MRSFPKIALATQNRGKLEEFEALFSIHKIHLVSFDRFVRNASSLAQVEAGAHGKAYYDHAFAKCHAAFLAAKVPTLADDSGIEIESLQGQPGMHSAHFGKPTARESQDQANRRKVLELLKGKKSRKAIMRCTLVFMVEGVVLHAEGVCEGQITEKEIGEHGFGYDAIFAPDSAGGKTFAELSLEEKNRLSHRALAVNELVRLIQVREVELVRP